MLGFQLILSFASSFFEGRFRYDHFSLASSIIFGTAKVHWHHSDSPKCRWGTGFNVYSNIFCLAYSNGKFVFCSFENITTWGDWLEFRDVAIWVRVTMVIAIVEIRIIRRSMSNLFLFFSVFFREKSLHF